MKLFIRAIVAASAASALLPLQSIKAADLQINVTNTGTFQTNADTSYNSTQPSTVQYNSSQGQNNNFAVGANTSFGATASASSTPDYSVSSSAVLKSNQSGSLFHNQIGSSGASQAASSWASAAGSYASSFTNELVNSATTSAKYQVNGGWEYREGGANGTGTSYKSEAAFQAAYKQSDTYKTKYEEAFNSSYSNFSGSGSNSSNSAVGTISGSFESTSKGDTSAAAASSASQAKTIYVAETYKSETSDTATRYREATALELSTGKGNGGAELTFYTAKKESSDSGTESINYNLASAATVAQASSAAASASSSSASTNKVVVTGIGSDAAFNASTDTKFDVAIDSNLGKVNQLAFDDTAAGYDAGSLTGSQTTNKLILTQGDGQISSSATANGSANGSFGTNSTASSNSATYTSVFYQAF